MKKLFRKSLKWSLGIAVITLVLAAVFSIISNGVLGDTSWYFGLFVVLCIVVTGIIFDIIGVAATAADEQPFHSMAADRVWGAKHAIAITRNADRVASFCNDVIGDISGIVSGTAAAIVVVDLAKEIGQANGNYGLEYIISVVFTSIIAALTVGGKAFGKSYAIKFSNNIIIQVGRLFYILETRLRITLFDVSKRKKVSKRNVK